LTKKILFHVAWTTFYTPSLTSQPKLTALSYQLSQRLSTRHADDTQTSKLQVGNWEENNILNLTTLCPKKTSPTFSAVTKKQLSDFDNF